MIWMFTAGRRLELRAEGRVMTQRLPSTHIFLLQACSRPAWLPAAKTSRVRASAANVRQPLERSLGIAVARKAAPTRGEYSE